MCQLNSTKLGGLMALWSRDKEAAAGATVMILTFTIGLVYYLNFKYGFSYHPERTLEREVRERDYFFVASFSEEVDELRATVNRAI